MNKQQEALKLALEALEAVTKEMLAIRDEIAERGGRPKTNAFHQRLWDSSFAAYTDKAIPTAEAIREALAEQPAPCSHITNEQKIANGLAWLERLEALRKECEALAEQPAPVAKPHEQQEPVEYWTVADGWVSEQAEVPAAAWIYPEFWDHCKMVGCGTAYRLPGDGRQPLYTSPPASKSWVGLTAEDKVNIEKIVGITEDDDGWMVSQMFTLTEAKLREKNT